MPSSAQGLASTCRHDTLGRLAASVAHDVNNLLGIVSNSMHLVQRHAAAGELQAPVAATLRAVDAGTRLTGHLLRLAHAPAPRPRPVDLTGQMPGLQEMLQTLLGRRVRVLASVAPGTATVHVDPDELALALVDLGLVARQGMPAGGELRIEAREATAADGLDDLAAASGRRHWVLLCVSGGTPGPGAAEDPGWCQARDFCAGLGGCLLEGASAPPGTRAAMLLPGGEPAPTPTPVAGHAGAEDAADAAARARRLPREGDSGRAVPPPREATMNTAPVPPAAPSSAEGPVTAANAPVSFGVFNPRGKVLIGLGSDERRRALRQDLHEHGWADEDMVLFVPDEGATELEHMVASAGPLAEFGYERMLLSRYLELTQRGVCWLLVKVDGPEQAARLTELARQHGAELAVHYRRFTIDELI
ncbi:MAG: hypothetical protein U1F53_09555 [Burkholderiaceae bacterium]